ncbi:MAG: hypothetical protein ACLSVY_09010, partial [Ruminococcus callidus]
KQMACKVARRSLCGIALSKGTLHKARRTASHAICVQALCSVSLKEKAVRFQCEAGTEQLFCRLFTKA